MFRAVGSRVDFPELEKGILDLWRQNHTFLRSTEARRGGPRFVFYEGPPTANGSPGIHHVLARAFKDVILRYRTMKGYYVEPRIAGWDTHGLPVELEVEKKLGFSSKAQIEGFGIEKFNALCRESVLGYLKEWDDITERIGFWVDLEHPYVTMANSYIESVWWAIKTMWDRGLIYQGYRVTPHCPRCGTSLSSHEVAQGYQDNTEDPSVYVKFRVTPPSLKDSPVLSRLHEPGESPKPVYLLAWTTTPWTLPGNTALAIAPDAEYVAVKEDTEYLILAAARLEPAGLGEYEVVERFKGNELVGLHYEPLYKIDVRYAKEDKRAYRVIGGDFVSMEDGTGIVHVAPAYGEIDFEVGQREGLPLVHTVELNGMVTTNLVTGFTPKAWEYIQKSEIPVTLGPARLKLDLPGAGKFVKDADKDIIADLKDRGLLFRAEKISHTYPFCWRCEAPLLYYAKETWYIRTTAAKDVLIKGNEAINWYPDHIKYGRFGDWLENNVDWAFSRERYWGTPLPVWRCEACGNYDCVGGVAELKGKEGFSGLREPLDLHRPFMDEATFECARCHGKMRRVPEVIDCWFDSGAMPFAQHHYPFEHKELFDKELGQADYICEAIDQTRGWFYSLHAISTLLYDHPAFKNVICLGHILDEKGEKMSKRKGNVVKPMMVIGQHGADALRWYCFTASPPGNVRRFSEKLIAEITRRVLLTLWNVYSFFVTYANIDRFDPSQPCTPELAELDRWILSELNELVLDTDRALADYNPTDAGRKIEAFIDELSNWYVRRSRRRFWKSESDIDKLAAYNTLYQCLVTLAKLLAPFAPFLAEELYQNLVVGTIPGAPDSVHMADFPVADEGRIDEELMFDTQLAMKTSSVGRALRSQAGIKVRQPLAKLMILASSQRQRQGLERLAPQIMEEVNVKELAFIDQEPSCLKYEFLLEEANEKGDLRLGIATTITPELRAEGLAREIVHRLQTLRRNAGFEIADHIVTYYEGDDYVREVMTGWADYIRQETLSREIISGVPQEGASGEKFKLEGHEAHLAVCKLD